MASSSFVIVDVYICEVGESFVLDKFVELGISWASFLGGFLSWALINFWFQRWVQRAWLCYCYRYAKRHNLEQRETNSQVYTGLPFVQKYVRFGPNAFIFALNGVWRSLVDRLFRMLGVNVRNPLILFMWKAGGYWGVHMRRFFFSSQKKDERKLYRKWEAQRSIIDMNC